MTASQRAATPFDLDSDELESMQEFLNAFNGQDDLSSDGIIEARVLDTDERDVFFDVGHKQDGRCALSEFPDPPTPGDVVRVVVMASPQDGIVRLSRLEAERRLAWQQIREAREADASLRGRVVQQLKAGYILDCGGVHLFMPLSQSDIKTNLRNRYPVGQELDFKVLEIKDGHRSAVVSHRQIIEERNDESWNELTAKYKEGDEVEGQVTKKVSFGVFVKVLGVEGLLHQNDISWKRYASFKNRFKVGESLQVKILSMDRENNRLALGLKQLSEDPWVWAAREIQVGAILQGKVISVTGYGAFIEFREGLEGLVHVSELTWSKRPQHPKKYVKVGSEVSVKVLAIDPEKKRLSLGIRQLSEDPWEVMGREIKVGDEREGRVTAITKFGAFVEIKDQVEGLIHFNDYSWDDRVNRKLLSKGDVVKFRVLDIDRAERRIACGIKQLSPSPFELLRQKHKKGAIIEGKVTRVAPFGLFVDIGDGFEGLVHVSRIPRIDDRKFEERFKPGDTVHTVLQSIDAEQKKISLSIKAYEQKKEREMISQYLKKDDSPGTSSLGSFLKNQSL